MIKRAGLISQARCRRRILFQAALGDGSLSDFYTLATGRTATTKEAESCPELDEPIPRRRNDFRLYIASALSPLKIHTSKTHMFIR
jgi:hypothetical protein